MEEEIRKRAVDAGCLDERIRHNVGSQKVDLVKWIFDRIHVEPGSRVLELCCGTGNQTLKLLECVGESGLVAGLDVSEEALKKLREKTGLKRGTLTTLAGSMDDLKNLLDSKGFEPRSFDLVFCAYGLYYSEKPAELLHELLNWLKEAGRMVVVGPFGPNNGDLFDFLEQCGVKIPDYVLYTSRDFMEKVVIPFSIRSFVETNIQNMVNPVSWETQDDVFEYWKNSTFYDVARQTAVRSSLKLHFREKEKFVNEKWVMMVEMTHPRAKEPS